MSLKQAVQKQRAEDDNGLSAFQDRTPRFPLDQLLRQNGFRIHQRTKNQEAVWLKDHIQFRQQEALLRLDKFAVSCAKQIEQQYDVECG